MDRSVLLRADGGPRIGMGHVMRCIAFAEGLSERGYRPILLLKGLGIQSEELINKVPFETEFLPSDISLEEDVHLTLETARENSVQLLGTDICHALTLVDRSTLDEYLQNLQNQFSTLCLTGSQDIDFPSDVVVSPYYRSNYPEISEDMRNRYLFGPDYFIFRGEFIRAAAVEYSVNEYARRILVSIGGSDNVELTIKISQGLRLLENTDLHVRIVIGPAYPEHIEVKVRELLSACDIKLDILHGCSDMAAEMLWADIAVIGDGLTKYEAAVTGTPCITLSRPDSDETMNAEFARAGSSIHLGNGAQISAEKLERELHRVCTNYSMRMQMSEKGRMLVDGRGVGRIIDVMPH